MPIVKLLLASTILALSTFAAAQPEPQISALSTLDRQYMEQQRELLQDIAARHLGSQFNGERDHDLELLQTLLDRNLIRPQQTRELQAMGVILGDHLAAELDLHWVVYQDEVGRSRALRYRESDNYLFPITMISRRQEAGSQTPVEAIYDKARGIMQEAKPALPFQ